MTWAITVNRSREDVYGYWHDFENLPTFMHRLEKVTVNGDNRSHWTPKAPAGRTVQWDAEVTHDRTKEGSTAQPITTSARKVGSWDD